MEAKRPFSNLDWTLTPGPVKQYIIELENIIRQLQNRQDVLEKRIEMLEARLNQNSQNSSKPPSSDGPFNKPKRKSKRGKRKRGAQKGHYTHQHIELPEIKMDVTHFILHKGKCNSCGKTVRARVPNKVSSGYGPRLSAVIAELSGSHGASRLMVQDFCQSVLGVPISVGGIQRVIDRVSEAIEPIYSEIGNQARKAKVNGVDETSWLQSGKLKWLWTMVNETVSFFMIHQNRSKQAFDELVADWKGILISDNYRVYVNWINKRQTCLAHFIRKAKGLAERKDESIRRFGRCILKELKLLCHWARKPPDEEQWTDFYSRLLLLLMLFEGADDDAGRLARSIAREMESLWLFLDEKGVEPTNNRSERALRFAVMWRKRSNGTQSDKGDRWVERILSLKQTCRIRSLSVFPILTDAIDAFFKEQVPDLQWITANY